MPSAIEYVSPIDVARGRFNQVISTEFQERKTAYTTALAYYEGTADAPFVASGDDPEHDPTVDNTTINMVKMAADRTASFLFPSVPKVQTDPASIEDTDEEKWLQNDFLDGNGGLHLLTKWALRGFLAGHTFLWVTNKKPVPKLVVLHPLSITAFWRADDIGEIVWYEQRFLAQGSLYLRDFIQNEDGSWTIALYKSKTETLTRADKILNQITNHGHTDATWSFDSMQFGQGSFELVSTSEHSSSIPPLLDTAHLPHPDDYYGMGEFTDKDLLDTINKIASERTRIIRQNADPVDVVTGVQDGDIVEDGNIVTIAAPNAKVTRLALTGDLHAVNSTLEHLIEQFLGIMRVVILKGEAKDLQRVTNAAVRTLFLDALAKNEILWSSYRRTLSMACKLAMEFAYANKELANNPADLIVTLQMASPLPVDKSEIANINALAINAGYRSLRTAATELGDDYQAERESIDAEFALGLERQKQTMELAQSFAPDEEEGTDNADFSE